MAMLIDLMKTREWKQYGDVWHKIFTTVEQFPGSLEEYILLKGEEFEMVDVKKARKKQERVPETPLQCLIYPLPPWELNLAGGKQKKDDLDVLARMAIMYKKDFLDNNIISLIRYDFQTRAGIPVRKK